MPTETVLFGFREHLHGRRAHGQVMCARLRVCTTKWWLSPQVMATDAPPGERRLRGAGIYPRAAMLNHDCMPNLARCEADAKLQMLSNPTRGTYNHRSSEQRCTI